MTVETSGIDLLTIKKKLATFVNERNWHSYHTPKNLILSLNVEVAELMEHFLWRTDEEILRLMEDDETEEQIKEELADVFNNLMTLCMLLEVDIMKASLEKIEKNNKKYPVEKFNSVHPKNR